MAATGSHYGPEGAGARRRAYRPHTGPYQGVGSAGIRNSSIVEMKKILVSAHFWIIDEITHISYIIFLQLLN